MSIVHEKIALEKFEELAEMAAAARDAALAHLKMESPALAERVAALLAADQQLQDRLPTTPPPAAPPAPDLPPPPRVGVYRITELLGRGGMGEVWRGERDDGLFDHTVAIKFMRSRHSSAIAHESFEWERRNLARLQHPNIAQLYDGGNLQDGRAYLIMELVQGQAVDAFVREHRFSAARLLQLFAGICAAVRAAHQALIVHADLKPSNVIVTTNGDIKLLDFGVSRLLGSGAGLRAPSGSETPLTIAYASPQRGRGEPPGVLDDIYSLGVMLHELLTGTRPDPAARSPLPRDLAAIVARACHPSPADRYTAVADLVADIDRYTSFRPVSAREPTRGYLLGRFVRRHRGGVAFAATLFVGLVTATTVSSSLYLQAESARQRANKRFGEVRQLSNFMLGDLQQQMFSLPQSLELRRSIVARGQSYLDQLAIDPSAPVEVRLDAIEGLVTLAEVQGVPGGPNMADTAAARRNLDRARTIANELIASGEISPRVYIALARTEIDTAAIVAARDNKPAEAATHLQIARSAIDAAAAAGASPKDLTRYGIEWRLRRADIANWASEYPRAMTQAREALALLASAPAGSLPERDLAVMKARALDLQAEATYYSGDQAGALQPYREEVEILEQAAATAPRDTIIGSNQLRAYWSLGTTLLQVQQYADALTPLSRAVALGRELTIAEPKDGEIARKAEIAFAAYGQALGLNNRHEEAIEILSDTVARRSARRASNSTEAVTTRDLAVSLAMLGDELAQAGHRSQACVNFANARAEFSRLQVEGANPALNDDASRNRLRESEQRYCAHD